MTIPEPAIRAGRDGILQDIANPYCAFCSGKTPRCQACEYTAEDYARAALTAALPHLETAIREDTTQRLARAAFVVDSKHHFWDGELGPTCLCGYIGNARKRTQTEHITLAVMEAFDHD